MENEVNQLTLDEYLKKEFKCRKCRKVFSTPKALNEHITKIHVWKNEEFWMYYGEEISEIREGENFVEFKVRVKKTLWNDIKKNAIRHKIAIDELIFLLLSNHLAITEGLEPTIQINERKKYEKLIYS